MIVLIVTLTINPAIDRIFSVDRLAFEDRSYINSVGESAGGRGINASRVIHSFGGDTHAVLISGGDTGKRLEEHLADAASPPPRCRSRTPSAPTSPSPTRTASP
jgi:fructose-1-phosphate kinase PfkB-like protein